jgi:cobalt-zinc-cadmium resistance protein CzcA
LSEIQKIPIKVVAGVPVRVEDVARVGYGNAIRRGVVTHNGTEEVVSGIVLKLFGENSSKVIEICTGRWRRSKNPPPRSDAPCLL